MPLEPARFQALLDGFRFDSLFNELGWDHAGSRPQTVQIGGETFTLTPVAQKRGVMIFHGSPNAEGGIPPRATLLQIEQEAAKLAHEHLLIFTDAARTLQTWLWVSRAPGQPVATRTHTWRKGGSGEALRQKLEHIAFSLDEEEALTLSGVTVRLRDAFDRDRVTRAFYDRFSSEHKAFTAFIAGIAVAAKREWYASLMLNRLMFVYFIQRKGFLDGNVNYLGDRLCRVRAEVGQGHFHSFYRRFLRRLFHEGLGQPRAARGAELDALLGDVPYLNGGLFAVHELEEANPEIDIPDEAFERLFRFFDAYDWHLDDRPLASGTEINPDVLGYIFEKYINQKQMGAYYTKEDITGYIAKNTVLPFLLERARERCKVAFEGEASVWGLLRDDPDRYLYPAMKRGVIDRAGQIVPEDALPDFVRAGMKDAKARMFDRRYNLGEANFTTATGETGALPTETWREYVERRTRCLALRDRMRRGEIQAVDDLVTHNLDIRQFMQDVIDTCGGPELLRAIWQGIVGRVPEKAHERFRHGIAILDPTCGSGAFLFAALNILEPLYEACLERMDGFIQDASKHSSSAGRGGGDGCSPRPLEEGSGGDGYSPRPLGEGSGVRAVGSGGKYPGFRRVLDEVARHPSRRYYIYKSIILHNLFGVDLMAEAVEICKLRLFLKLVSQVEVGASLEPLPDIDFNIRAGNTLVGFATERQFDDSGNLASDQDHRAEIKARIADLADAFDRFREQQTVHGGQITAEDKRALRERLNALSGELDRYLAREYGKNPDHPAEFEQWRATHQPFHWFAEFHGVMVEGGFDVVIGNPPYVEYSQVIKQYSLKNYSTEKAGNLYAFTTERALCVLCNRGYIGFVVQQPIVSTQRMQAVRNMLLKGSRFIAFSTYDDRPSKLFDGIHHARIAIFLAEKANKQVDNNANTLFVSSYQKWYKEERQILFQRISYLESHNHVDIGVFPKIRTSFEDRIIKRLLTVPDRLGYWITKEETENRIYYKITGVGHWITVTTRPPRFYRQDEISSSSREKFICFSTPAIRDRAFAILNSSLFYWFYQVRTNCRDFNPSDYSTFPVSASLKNENFSDLALRLIGCLDASTTQISVSHSKTGAIKIEQFRPRIAKPVIDDIDQVLSKHYEFDIEETDFIINYDIKYRMGGADDEGGE